mmetsp:Transcript_56740/g.47875  ORF Transcript_56740/g.47875 Transcript_56740/m.47875 type:complete len:91 (-) Transcript_56740:2-274(-)
MESKCRVQVTVSPDHLYFLKVTDNLRSSAHRLGGWTRCPYDYPLGGWAVSPDDVELAEAEVLDTRSCMRWWTLHEVLDVQLAEVLDIRPP